MSTANPAGVLPFSVIWDMVRQRRIGRRIHSCGMAMSMVIYLVSPDVGNGCVEMSVVG
ncbi:MAG: hypothetical protein JRI71_06015 [Deltaproteobacteria bacterium]|nr:hypothetical protein [Deltaproteobacteria bacterium]